MNEEKSLKGNTVLLTVITVITLLVAVIGTTFAYFSVSVNNSGDTSVLIKSANLAITHNNGNTVNAQNIVPGASITPKIFQVSNSSTTANAITYNITWDVTNGFSTGALKYTLKHSTATFTGACSSAGTVTTIGSENSSITKATSQQNFSLAGNRTVNQGITDYYCLAITFANNTSSDQSADMNQTFSATIKVDADTVGS